ncbi:branched-chain amino acid ABC transporter substrate-binding protein [Paraburkholderia sp. BL10I2N1]|uniref:branched-chain amino acid ABC transporter substrate-binding protein n=1 Tax=Paraburkholderia sp. BL10I2N1 TaxID=1938796 RepID=UPI00105BBEEA|nr:branched-chain amino acid ABC transporter substrate-binding protein [Paraburkholderia sp. BL10I2N1]TDN58703.1 amino acid/amide ABC transporter substrate-binding protein (HAAT family) [Paraburkholderia sp. BL10I2N1]
MIRLRAGACVLAVGVLSLAPLLATAGEEQVVKIGLTGPLTGAQAAIGKDDENGVRMAIERLNAQGLTIGGKKTRFELVSQDDAADPRTGMTVAQSLVDDNVKVIFGPFNSGVAIPISNLVNGAGIVMATVASNPSITQRGYPFIFRISASDTQLGSRMGAFAAKQLKVTRMAVIDDRTAYGQGVADEFVKAARAEGIEIVDREYTTDKATNFDSILTRIKGTKAEGIFYGGYYSQAAPLRKQMKRLAMNGYLLGGDAVCNLELAKLAGDAVDGRVYCPQGGPVLDQTPAGRQFKTDYKKRFNTDPLTYSASLYDGMNIVASAMQKANSIEPAQYRAALAGADMQGVAGHYQFDGNRDLSDSPITIYTYRNGQLTPLSAAQR